MLFETVQSIKISLLPPDDDESRHFCVVIEHRGGGRYAVNRGGFDCQLSRTGEWDWWPGHEDVTDEWLDMHRYSLDEAKEMAKEYVGDITVNGWIVKDGVIVHTETGKRLRED